MTMVKWFLSCKLKKLFYLKIILTKQRAHQITDVQLEKTHADLTQALLPTEQTNWIILGMFVTIQTRYNDCQTRNQVLTAQIRNLSDQLYPMLSKCQTEGLSDVSKASAPTLAIGLISNVLQGRIEMNDAQQIIVEILKMWNESKVWYEFFEQFVYILVATTVPCLAQRAMGKIMGKVFSSK